MLAGHNAVLILKWG